MKLKLSNRSIAIAGFVIAVAAGLYLFGMMGARLLLAMAAFFCLPFYLVLRKFKFEEDERLFFAFFMGIGLFSLLVFYVGRVIPSFMAATAIAFILLLLLPFAVKKMGK